MFNYFLILHACGVRVDGASPRRFLRFLSLTALRAEGCGGGFAASFIKRGAAGAAGCVEGLHRFAQGATAPAALRVADCRSAAILIKSALRDLLSVLYGIVSILMISRYAAPPYPAAPDFLHGKACHTILRSLCSLTNRVPLPPHPGDRINRSMLSCRDMAPWLSIHSPTTKWGEGGGASHQRGIAFPTPAGRLYGFIQTGAFYNLEAPPQPSAAKPLSNLRTFGAIAPSNFRTLTPIRACP